MNDYATDVVCSVPWRSKVVRCRRKGLR